MPHAPADRLTRVALLAYPEFLDHIMPQLAQLRGMDKLKIAPYLERVQKHLEQQKKPVPGGGALRRD